MYYIEEFRNGDWWYKTTPDGPWYKFTREKLLTKIKQQEDIITPINEIYKEFIKEKICH